MLEATEHMKQYDICKKTINSVSDSGFTVLKELIAKSGRIIYDRSSAEASVGICVGSD